MLLRSGRNCVAEWPLGRADGEDPSASVDVIVSTPSGRELRVPTFEGADDALRVRYASGEVGAHAWRVDGEGEFPREAGEIEITDYEGANPLFEHGPLQLSEDRRHLRQADGTPFFWLGDTWWMALCERLRWPDEFRRLTADRVAKGFNVIQLVAGLYPDMNAFDPRGDSEVGWPWTAEWKAINPAWWDLADLKIEWLVAHGLMPCILGSWGYYLPWLGVERFKRHWREMIARWGAYPVVWCLAGEGAMPWYLREDKEQAAAEQRAGWTEVGRYVREADPFGRLVTIHPTRRGREQVEDDSVLDFEMLQTGHGDRRSLPNTVRSVRDAYEHEPTMPVINAEVCYEGIVESCREEVQRMMFWVSLLGGTCGHTYGANGIWQFNRREEPFGPSPHGRSWGDRPWDEVMELPGSAQMGVARRLLERFEWWRIEPHPEWVEPRWSEDDFMAPFAAGIPGELRIFYLFNALPEPTVHGIEPGAGYDAMLVNPSTGERESLGVASGDDDGAWRVPLIRMRRDWLVVLTRQR
ncbi:MAG: DUF4038 domain-containing protein [Armatimonadota bacterium]|jgi:hypothetical protein